MTDTKRDMQVVRTVASLAPALAYRPTEDMRRVKARFWLEFRKNPTCDLDKVNSTLVQSLTGADVSHWDRDPDFWPWFASSKDTIRENIEIASEKASELAMFYLDPSVPFNDNARVQLIKYILEFGGRTPPARKEVKWHDAEVSKMTKEQLEAYVARLTGKTATGEAE